MPLLGNVTAAFPAVGPAAANATIPAGPLPTVNMPGSGGGSDRSGVGFQRGRDGQDRSPWLGRFLFLGGFAGFGVYQTGVCRFGGFFSRKSGTWGKGTGWQGWVWLSFWGQPESEFPKQNLCFRMPLPPRLPFHHGIWPHGILLLC